MTCLAIVNCDIYTPAEHIPRGLVLIDGKQVRALGPSHAIPLPADVRLIDAEGGRITPGLIDLKAQEERAEPAVRGVTAYLTAVNVRGEEDFVRMNETAAALSRAQTYARPLGLHIVVPEPDAVHWRDLWIAADGTIRVVTLGAGADPELAGKLQGAGVAVFEDGGAGQGVEWKNNAGADQAEPETETESVNPRHRLASLDALRSTRMPEPNPDASPEQIILTGSVDHALQARMVRELMALDDLDFGAALACATSRPAALLGHIPCLAVGAPADLICWTRYGDVAWVMVGGRIAHPAPKTRPQPLGKAGTKRMKRRRTSDGSFIYTMNQALGVAKQAAADITTFLETQDETIAVENVEDDPQYQVKDIDLIWRIRREDGQEERITIEVKGDTWAHTGKFFFETASNKEKGTPGCFLQTEAHWYFYYFTPTRQLYCLPLRSTRAWFLEHEKRFRLVSTRTQVGSSYYTTEGRLVPITEVMAAIPRARHVALESR